MADPPYHAAIAFLAKPLRFRILIETVFSLFRVRSPGRVRGVGRGGGVLQDGAIQDDGMVGFRMRCFVVVACASSVRRGVAWPTCPRIRSIATAAAAAAVCSSVVIEIVLSVRACHSFRCNQGCLRSASG